MFDNLKTKVSRYVSYLLRHNPEGLAMDRNGFVELSEIVSKVKKRFPSIDRAELVRMVDESEKRRFEIVGSRVRALYGHTVPIDIHLEENNTAKTLYHGTTPQASWHILNEGLKPMRRRWVHLSPTKEIALEVGSRRAKNPVILVIDACAARKRGIHIYKATDKVYLCRHVPAKYIKKYRSR